MVHGGGGLGRRPGAEVCVDGEVLRCSTQCPGESRADVNVGFLSCHILECFTPVSPWQNGYGYSGHFPLSLCWVHLHGMSAAQVEGTLGGWLRLVWVRGTRLRAKVAGWTGCPYHAPVCAGRGA